jgi:NADH dehydrogenase
VIDAEGQVVPATAQSALQAARCVAWNLWASRENRTLQPFRYQALGEMVSLGRGDAALSGLGLTLSGPLAAAARRLVYISRQPTAEQRWRVGVTQIGRLLSGAMLRVKP